MYTAGIQKKEIMVMKKAKLNTVTNKSVLLTVIWSFLLLLLIELLLPTAFYKVMHPHFADSLTSSVNAASMRQSYILTSNAHWPAADLLSDYFSGDRSQDLRSKIQNRLKPLRVGDPHEGSHEEGAISFVNYPAIITENGDFFCAEETHGIAEKIIKTAYFSNLPKKEGWSGYSPVLSIDVDGTRLDLICFVSAFSVEDVICYSVTIRELSNFTDQLTTLNSVGISDYALFNRDGIIFSNLGESSEIVWSDYMDSLSIDGQYQITRRDTDDGMDFLVLCSYRAEGFRLAVHASKAEILAPYNDVFLLTQVGIILLVVLLISMESATFRFFLRGLSTLNNQMNKVQSGNYEIVPTQKSHDEIGNLAKTFHIMLDKIKLDMKERIDLEKRKQELQYSLLVSALDPHFIYNTLDMVTYLAEMEQHRDVVKVIDALIDTLKDRLTMKGYKTFDSVAVEKHVLEKYMLIQSYMRKNKISFDFIVSDQDLSLRIPKNIIQPLVENSIKHGILSNKEDDGVTLKDGKIEVIISRQEDGINIQVIDNGTGISPETQKRLLEYSNHLKDPEHTGIKNLQMRLSYLFKDCYRFEIHSISGEGTRIIIWIPEGKK